MQDADFIIVGAGSAGCVLAEKLSANPAIRVLLLEAGLTDSSPYVHMPKGMAKLYTDPAQIHYIQTTPHNGIPAETWIRGKLLGGSSSINGMMYFRGQPQDYDAWEDAGCTGWGWSQMGRVFSELEDHALSGTPGANPALGRGGPLRITSASHHTKLTEAIIAAGVQMGLPRRAEVTQTDGEGVAYATHTIGGGRRQSAARAFLRRARGRKNLIVRTGVTIEQVLFEGRRAAGVRAQIDGVAKDFRTNGEVILSAGALASPVLLQRSGVGDAPHLRALGVEVVHHSPDVGRHLLEHRLLMMQYELLQPLSQNTDFRSPLLYLNALRYLLTRAGPFAGGSYDVAAFVRTDADDPLPDVEILMAPYSLSMNASGGVTTGAGHAIHLFGYPLRSRSEGSVSIVSADPAVPPAILPNYLSDIYDQATTLRMFRYIRNWMRQPTLVGLVGEETLPGPALESDADIITAFLTQGQAGYHACGTCRMGTVLDSDLRVIGTDGLRVVDGSMMPTMVSCNTNGPITAVGWRAAELILRGRNR